MGAGPTKSTSNVLPSYGLHGKDFHKLSQLRTNLNQIFQIKIQEKIFNLTKEEAFLISPKCYVYILKHLSPFVIPLPPNKNINSGDLILAFEQLTLLFSSLTQVLINQSNVQTIKYLSEVLENEHLKNACNLVLRGNVQNHVFELSSKMFQ
jgi:hypothetical protein